jgi:hypothetical protein
MLIPVKRLVNCVGNVVQQAFNLLTTSSKRFDFSFSLKYSKSYLRRINCLGNSSRTFSKNVFKQRNSGSTCVEAGYFSPLRYDLTRLNGVRTKQRPSINTHSFSDIDGRLKSFFPSSQSRQLVCAMSGNC